MEIEEELGVLITKMEKLVKKLNKQMIDLCKKLEIKIK